MWVREELSSSLLLMGLIFIETLMSYEDNLPPHFPMNPLMLRTRSSKLKVTRFRVKGPDCICCRPGTKMKESASHHINRIIDKDAPEDICRNIVRQHKEI